MKQNALMYYKMTLTHVWLHAECMKAALPVFSNNSTLVIAVTQSTVVLDLGIMLLS